ncbi:MAG: hydroxyacid dehydrogenase [Opitutus sp.]
MAIAGHTSLLTPSPLSAQAALERLEVLNQVQVLFTGWGCPKLDEDFLRHVPNLKAVFYAAGSLKPIVSNEFWKKDIEIFSAVSANAIPVADFALAAVIMCLKSAFSLARGQRAGDAWRSPRDIKGTYKSTVGLVGLGTIGRMVRKRLEVLDVRVVAYDPYFSTTKDFEGAVELVALDKLFELSDVVSIHAPLNKSTQGMVGQAQLERMKRGGSIINTSRGGVIVESELIAFLEKRPDIQAVLDVCDPEPPDPNSPLRTLENVFLTPHISGSTGPECIRMGRLMVEEFIRWKKNGKLLHKMTRERASEMG